MASLARELRKDLGNKVREARGIAEAGARKVIESLAVHSHDPWGSMSPEDRKLRNRLRVHGRQLGDRLDSKIGTQSIGHLISEVAYEHWHGMLFARFLAENDLLLMPNTTTAITLDEVEEIARAEGRDWLTVVSEYAEKMLPQIFRSGDPALEVALPLETRKALEEIIRGLDTQVFTADDSLGWVYQFWQADRKDEINKSGNKIGADELPAVTQLFTEDYMVLFLLHNTLGAWWAGKVLAERPELATSAKSEDELRAACKVGDLEWTYLRFVRDSAGDGAAGSWRPAAGAFEGWPKAAKDVTVLDPCMGSGHFLVFALLILVALRMAEEDLSREAAVDAVLRDNLFGLEIDPRCTQIAAFNLAFAAWRMVGYRLLPQLNLACSGLAIGVTKTEWLKLAGDNDRLQRGMERLYVLFKDAPVLGSLIDPRAAGGDLLEAEFHELQPLLEKALAREAKDDTTHEMAVTARGVAKAAEILAGHFTLVATNVPYLGRGKQNETLQDYCERVYPDAKSDLATCFVKRCLDFCAVSATMALVTPQNWLFLTSYGHLRVDLLQRNLWNIVAKLGPGAFETIGGEVVNVALLAITHKSYERDSCIAGLDATSVSAPSEKAVVLLENSIKLVTQSGQERNPDARVTLEEPSTLPLLEELASCLQGISPADFPHYGRCFWEINVSGDWHFWQSTIDETCEYGGRELVLWWNQDLKDAVERGQAYIRGSDGWGHRGVVVRQMSTLPVTIYTGEKFDTNCAVIVPRDIKNLAAIWAYCSSEQYHHDVRQIDQKLNVTNATLVKVPFDLSHWQKVATKKYPQGLPKPFSSDPTQWLFNGQPKGSDQPLQVAVARLLGYHWPRQTGSSFPDCPALAPDGLEKLANDDGIVCFSAIKGKPPAAELLNVLLSDAFGPEWSAAKLASLLTESGYAGKSLDDWLRDGFSQQHCELFQHRPFIWHVWDGRRDGFNALVNYHRLAAPDGEGLRTLDKLIYTYLGAWIERQENDQKAGLDGADGRLAAAQHLKIELEKIQKGEPPFDIFVRWKSLADQPKGWNPDINDGVRINIRPFMTGRPFGAKAKNACILRNTPRISWDKDRGKEPSRSQDEFPWFWTWDGETKDFTGGTEFDGVRWNNLHYSLKAKSGQKKDAV